MQHQNESSLKSVKFSLYSAEDVENLAVACITNSKRTGDGSVYDLRMGPIETSAPCLTCKLSHVKCPGHFGYIDLAQPIFHPLFFNRIESILNLVCVNCYKCLFSGIAPILTLSKNPSTRFAQLSAKIKRINYCTNEECKLEQPEIKTNTDEQFVFFNELNMTPGQIYFLLSIITPTEQSFMGIQCNLRGLIIFKLLVLPTCARPMLQSDSLICDDDLTMQYLDIIKINNDLAAEITKNDNEKIKNLFMSLKYRIAVMFNNSSKTARYNINLRPFKSIYERITGKEGHIRKHGMSKRADKTARSVISPNPFLRLDELSVPKEIAQVLTVPQIVSTYNFLMAEENFKSGKIKILQKSGTTFKIDAQKYFIQKKGNIEVGDIFWRPLQTGDWVLFNRQPTLHAPSMQAMKVCLSPLKTFQMNLANCPIYNADMDGDEMNIHVPQTIEAIVEMQLLSTPQNWLISEAHGGANFGLGQDALLGIYLITTFVDGIIDRGDWWQLWVEATDSFLQVQPKEYSPIWLINCLFPPNFNYSSAQITIVNSEIKSGCLTKSEIGFGSHGIFVSIIKQFGSAIATTFLESLQFLGIAWLSYSGYSIGLSDCVSLNINEIKNEFSHDGSVDEYFNKVGFIVRQNISKSNNICNLIEAGSKGNWINLVQITGCVGQQYLFGKKVHPVNDGKTLEEQGFIRNCYFDGLTPIEFWSHLIAARDAICSTATGTAVTGYLQRKLVKHCEFQIVQYDGTIREGKKIMRF